MNEELPELPDVLERSLPPAPAELRARVLVSVQQELSRGDGAQPLPRRRRPRWERAFELASAASLLIGIGITVWQWRADQAWHSRMHKLQIVENRSVDPRDPRATSDPQLALLLRQRNNTPAREHDRQGFSKLQARLLREIAAINGG